MNKWHVLFIVLALIVLKSVGYHPLNEQSTVNLEKHILIDNTVILTESTDALVFSVDYLCCFTLDTILMEPSFHEN